MRRGLNDVELGAQVLQIFAGDFAGQLSCSGVGSQILRSALLLVLQGAGLVF